MVKELEKLGFREVLRSTSLVAALAAGIVGEIMKPFFCLFWSPSLSPTLSFLIPSSMPTTTALFCTNSRQQSHSTQYWNSLLYCTVHRRSARQ